MLTLIDDATTSTSAAQQRRLYLGLKDGEVADLHSVTYGMVHRLVAATSYHALAWTGDLQNIDTGNPFTQSKGLFAWFAFEFLLGAAGATHSNLAHTVPLFQTMVADPYWTFLAVTAGGIVRMELSYSVRRASKEERLSLAGQSGWRAPRVIT